MSQTTVRTLPLLPLRELVILPGMKAGLEIAQPEALERMEAILATQPSLMLLAPVLDPSVESPGLADLSKLAVEVEIVSSTRRGDKLTAVVRGIARVRLLSLDGEKSQPTATFEPVTDDSNADIVKGTAMALRDQMRSLASAISGVPTEVRTLINDGKIGGDELADRVTPFLEFDYAERIELLNETRAEVRLDRVLHRLMAQRTKAEVRAEIHGKVQGNIEKSQREMVLRQQLRALEEEMRELNGKAANSDASANDNDEERVEKLTKRLAEAGLSDEARKVADRELKRLENLNPESPEGGIALTYLDWLASLPWQKASVGRRDVAETRRILDEDHFGQERIKRRLVEHVAVQQLASSRRAPLLCFVGPPGVGKSSLARSIAKALGREFIRISLGGVRDEAEIRGHRRTYIGALPGRIIQALKRVGTNNPVVLLDEIDKLSSDMRGDPEAALLEVLDPEQNFAFSDHYLDVPFDLSKVVFIATANDLSQLSPPLRDRMEVIDLPGYTRAEKKQIATNYLWPRQLAEHGLSPSQLGLSDKALELVIGAYTHEAGVRNLERELATLIRSSAVDLVEGRSTATQISPAQVQLILGPTHGDDEDAPLSLEAGHTIGLAWSPTGGSIMHIEVTQMPGKGGLQLTGQLGDVMKESAQASLSFVRSHLTELGLHDPLEGNDLHLHFPDGGTPKDGPSAGVAITAAFVSMASGRQPRPLTAATGEISLRGAVLPVGGIKEKLLAAHRSGVTRVILPERNRKDLVEVPAEVQNALELIFVSKLGPALDALLEPPAHAARHAA